MRDKWCDTSTEPASPSIRWPRGSTGSPSRSVPSGTWRHVWVPSERAASMPRLRTRGQKFSIISAPSAESGSKIAAMSLAWASPTMFSPSLAWSRPIRRRSRRVILSETCNVRARTSLRSRPGTAPVGLRRPRPADSPRARPLRPPPPTLPRRPPWAMSFGSSVPLLARQDGRSHPNRRRTAVSVLEGVLVLFPLSTGGRRAGLAK